MMEISTSKYRSAQVLRQRMEAIASRKSLELVAQESGFRSVTVLEAIIKGEVPLTLDRVAPLARSLELDTGYLLRLAMRDWRLGWLLHELEDVTPNERHLISLLRERTGGEFIIDQRVLDWVSEFPVTNE